MCDISCNNLHCSIYIMCNIIYYGMCHILCIIWWWLGIIGDSSTCRHRSSDTTLGRVTSFRCRSRRVHTGSNIIICTIFAISCAILYSVSCAISYAMIVVVNNNHVYDNWGTADGTLHERRVCQQQVQCQPSCCRERVQRCSSTDTRKPSSSDEGEKGLQSAI